MDHGQILAAIENADRPAFDAALTAFEKNPDQVEKLQYYGAITTGLFKSDPNAAVKILRDALARPDYNAAQRQGLLAQLCRLQRPAVFKYGDFYSLGDYETDKAFAGENLVEIDRALAEGSLKRGRNLAMQFHDMAITAADFGDYAWAAARLANARHLKGTEAPAVPEAYRTGVHIACDDAGLHIYVRCDNPAVGDIVAGQRKGESPELLVRPSEDAAYHSWHFNSDPIDNDELHLVNWASPTPRYRHPAG